MTNDHLEVEDYAALEHDASGAGWLALRIHRHLLATCAETRAAWAELGPLLTKTLDSELARLTPPTPADPCDQNLVVTEAAIDAQAERVEKVRYLRRRLFRQLWELRKLTPEQRIEKIQRATSRFRDPALAELLIEESRSTVRNQPAEAQRWAELVPVVLHWAHHDAPPAVHTLLLRAQAHRANALRVLGDLAAADRAFRRLRTTLAALHSVEPALTAEVASLEASLRLAQHELSRAAQLLEEAAAGYGSAGDPLGLARVRIQQGNLAWSGGSAAEALHRFDAAAAALDSATESTDIDLVLCTATGRVLALCGLARLDEAQALLDRHQEDFEASEEPFAAVNLRGLEARVALGRGRFDEAEAHFTSCRDALLALGRYHDAALACLDLAEVLCAAGRTDDLLALAAELVPLFRNRQLPVETARALDHLGRAITARRFSETLLAELRRRLRGPVGMTSPAS